MIGNLHHLLRCYRPDQSSLGRHKYEARINSVRRSCRSPIRNETLVSATTGQRLRGSVPNRMISYA
jgi:hypothetical protein